jgi:mono/diheme cytochrome c family protein
VIRPLPLRALAAALCLLATARSHAADDGAAQDYVLHCQGCHGVDAVGVPHKVPALRETLPLLITIDEGRDFVMRVPGAASSRLSDSRLAAVLNWLAQRYGSAGAAHREFTADEVASGRSRPLAGVRATRASVAARLAERGTPLPLEY